MRIAIDATPLLVRSAGVKNYVYHWISHLRRLAEAGSIRVFPFLGKFGDLDHERSQVGRLATWTRLGLVYCANIPLSPVADWIAPRADVFHLSNQVRNPPRKILLTATLHDMTCWLLPEAHTAANLRADRDFAQKVLPRVARLIAVSESTRSDAIRILDLKPERIEVIYPGVAEPYFNTTDEGKRQVRDKYRLVRPYVLFVGTIEPRKNIETLLDAYRQLAPSVRKEVDLVLAGPLGWPAGSATRRLLDRQNGVRYLGYVPEADLPGLTAAASVFAYPSLYEGFGFPAAQAMACGVPVVTSNLSSLPEICGEGAILVDPRSPAETCNALQRLLDDPALRATLGGSGTLIARRYRWETCAQKSLEFFRMVAGAS